VTGERIKPPNCINLVTEKLEPDSFFIRGCGINLNHVAAHTKPAAREIHVVALVKHVD
jgi:hypothetical protein